MPARVIRAIQAPALALVRHVAGFVVVATLVACGERSATGVRPGADGGASSSLSIASFGSASVGVFGSARINGGALQLTNGGSQTGTAWNAAKQRLSGSWETTFQFRISSAGCGALADGFAFVIQNQAANALPSGISGSDLGYSGLKSALAVEFDIFQSSNYPDPNDNHIAVVSGGVNAISARSTPLASATPPSIMKDGNTHTVRIAYARPQLSVYYDGAASPLINVNVDLLNIGGGSILDANGAAWVGFTGGTGGACASQQILSWNLTDNRAPTATAGGTVGSDGVARYTATEGSPLTLTASATDPDNDPIASYEWDFNGDGVADVTSTSPSVNHVFPSCGTVPISVVAVDALGSRSAPAPAQVLVQNVDPVVAAVAPMESTPGQTVSLTTTFTDPGADGPWTYTIEWGDGLMPSSGTLVNASDLVTGTHVYQTPRVDPYPVTIKVTDKCGAVGVQTSSVKFSKLPAVVHLDGLSQTYNGQPRPVVVTTDPAGINTVVTYDGAATVPVNAGSYAVVATIDDPRYIGSASGTLVVVKGTASIVLGGLSGQVYDGTAKPVSPSTTPSGLAVNVLYDGATAAPVNAGSYGVSASVNDPNWVGSASGRLVIDKASASIALDNLNFVYDGSAKPAHVSTTPANLAVVTVLYNGSSTLPVSAGSYAVSASLANANYQAAPVSATLTIAMAGQTIAFAPIPDHTYGDAPFTLVASGGGSTAPVTFALGGTSFGCTLAGATVTITKATPNGAACVIVAHQSGDANYLPAADVTRSFTVNRFHTLLDWSPATSLSYGAPVGSAQQNARALGVGGAVLPGTWSYSIAAGTVLEIGSYAMSASFAPADADDYDAVSGSATLRVTYQTSPGHVFLSPLGTRASYNLGPKIDVTFMLFSAGTQQPVTTAHATLVVQRVNGDGSLSAPLPLPLGTSFEYQAREGTYYLQLDSKSLGAGSFRLRADLDDGSSIEGTLSLRQSRGLALGWSNDKPGNSSSPTRLAPGGRQVGGAVRP